MALLACTGLLGIGYEVLVVRVLSQVAENTVYTFAILLAVYLVGTALGAAAYQRRLAGRPQPDKLRERLLCLHWRPPACSARASLWSAEQLQGDWCWRGSAPAWAAALAAEAALALAAFLLPTVVMGALFSHLCRQARAARHQLRARARLQHAGRGGRAARLRRAAGAALGAEGGAAAGAGGYLVLATRRAWARPKLWVPGRWHWH